VCIAKRPKDFEAVKNRIIQHLTASPLSLEELQHKMKSNDETWIKIFNELVDDGFVVLTSKGYKMSK